jgi:phosphoglycerate dehydrogenase-like enzyme
MALQVLISASMIDQNPDSLQAFADVGMDVSHLTAEAARNPENLVAALKDADGCILGGYPITAEIMEQCPRLKVISRTGVGVETVDLEAATRRGIAVTNIAGTDHDAVADATFCLMLDMARRFYQSAQQVKAGRWEGIFGADVCEKTIGIIGLGRVGKETAKRARGFRMTILAYDPIQDAAFARENGVTYTTLEDLLRQADFVCLNAALTPANRGIINCYALSLMKPTTYLINTARGALVDEEALMDALREKRLAGAALDVLGTEPPPRDHPFLQMDNVMITAHMGGSSIGASARVAKVAVANVIEVLQGGQPSRTVNKEVWALTQSVPEPGG